MTPQRELFCPCGRHLTHAPKIGDVETAGVFSGTARGSRKDGNLYLKCATCNGWTRWAILSITDAVRLFGPVETWEEIASCQAAA